MLIIYFFVRPFLKAMAKERRRMVRDQRAAAVNARIARRKAKNITWTDEEREYLRQHAVSPYR